MPSSRRELCLRGGLGRGVARAAAFATVERSSFGDRALAAGAGHCWTSSARARPRRDALRLGLALVEF